MNGYNQIMYQQISNYFLKQPEQEQAYLFEIQKMQALFENQEFEQLRQTLIPVAYGLPSQQLIVNLYKFIVQNSKRLDPLISFLFDSYLAEFLEKTSLAVFIIFIYTVHFLKKKQSCNFASQIYRIISTSSGNCCLIYLQFLRWAKAATLTTIMPSFIQYVQKDLDLVKQPLRSRYQSELNLYNLFYLVTSESWQSVQTFLSNIQINKSKEHMHDMYQIKLKCFYKLERLEQMIALKQQLFMLPNIKDTLKEYCCHTIGDLLYKRGRWCEAIEQLNQALEYLRHPMAIRRRIAECYLRLQNWMQICRVLQSFQHENIMSQWDYSLGMAIRGKAYFQMSSSPKMMHFNDHLTNIVGSRANEDQMLLKAIYYSTEALKYDPTNFLAQETLGLIEIYYTDNAQTATKRYQEFLETVGQTYKSRIVILLAYSIYAQGAQPMKAKTHLKQLSELELLDGFCYDFLANLIKAYRPDLLLSFQTSTKLIKQRLLQTMINFGKEAKIKNKIDCAINYFQFCLKKQKNNLICKLQIAKCYRLKKKQASALSIYKQVLAETLGLTATSLMLNKKLIFRNILELYLQLLENNHQHVLVNVAKMLEQIRDVFQLFQALLKQQKISYTKLDKIITQRIEQKLSLFNQVSIYLGLLKIYIQHNLQDYIFDIHRQIKANVFKQQISELCQNALMTFHRGQIYCELGMFKRAQQKLIRFLENVKDKKLQRFYNNKVQEAYVLLCSVFTHYKTQGIPYNLKIFQQLLHHNPISSQEAYQKLGQLFLDNQRAQIAIYYLSQTLKLGRSKITFERLISIYTSLLQAKVNKYDFQQNKQLLKQLIIEFQSLIEDKSDYECVIASCKVMKDLQLVERFYRKLIDFQINNKSRATAVKVQLISTYLEFGQFQKAGCQISQLFAQQPSPDLLEFYTRVVISPEPHALRSKQQVCQKIIRYYQNSSSYFAHAIIYSEFQQFDDCLSQENKLINQLKLKSWNEVKSEVEQKYRVLKKFTQNITNLLLQYFLQRLLLTFRPKDKNIYNLISINILPNIFRKLGSKNRCFGEHELSQLLSIFGQKISVKNKVFLFQFMYYENLSLKKQQQNLLLIEWITKYEEGLKLVNRLKSEEIKNQSF